MCMSDAPSELGFVKSKTTNGNRNKLAKMVQTKKQKQDNRLADITGAALVPLLSRVLYYTVGGYVPRCKEKQFSYV